MPAPAHGCSKGYAQPPPQEHTSNKLRVDELLAHLLCLEKMRSGSTLELT
jgi:hypothetical protein